MNRPKDKQTGHVTAIVLAVVVLAAVVLAGVLVAKHHDHAKTAASKTTSSTTSTASGSATPSTATDNASLTQDLQGVNSLMNQENSDNSTASGGLNDQQSEITVPTN